MHQINGYSRKQISIIAIYIANKNRFIYVLVPTLQYTRKEIGLAVMYAHVH